MARLRRLLSLGVLAGLMGGCVTRQQYANLQMQLAAEQQKEAETEQRLVASNDQIAQLRRQVAALSAQVGVPVFNLPTRHQEEPPMPVTLTFHRLADGSGFQVDLASKAADRLGFRIGIIAHPSGWTRRLRVFVLPGQSVLLGGDQPLIIHPGDEIEVTTPGFSKLDLVFHPTGSE